MQSMFKIATEVFIDTVKTLNDRAEKAEARVKELEARSYEKPLLVFNDSEVFRRLTERAERAESRVKEYEECNSVVASDEVVISCREYGILVAIVKSFRLSPNAGQFVVELNELDEIRRARIAFLNANGTKVS
jgi:hypothetical protein